MKKDTKQFAIALGVIDFVVVVFIGGEQGFDWISRQVVGALVVYVVSFLVITGLAKFLKESWPAFTIAMFLGLGYLFIQCTQYFQWRYGV